MLLSPLSASDLRDIVLEASGKEAQTTVDLQGLVWLEHINLVVGPSRKQAELFYLDILGCTPDASKSFHVNLGQQQFHLAVCKDDMPPQAIAGSIGIAVPSLPALRERLQGAAAVGMFPETHFAVLQDTSDSLTLRCPWGNVFRCYPVEDNEDGNKNHPTSPPTPQKMTNLHSPGGPYGPRMAVRGQPGIRFVELQCPAGSAPKIATFYRRMLQCTTTTTTTQHGTAMTTVSVGPGVHLVWVEGTDTLSHRRAMDTMKGVHLCVYTHNFRELYDRLSRRKLIWTNPRFVHLDTCDTWEEARKSRTLRFRYVVDLEKGDDATPLVELEHETRPLRHGQYLKVPRYMPMLPSKRSISGESPALSKRILETLDPCIVMMKEMVSQYAHLWQDDEIFSLAQGVVYWDPPETCHEALRGAIENDDNLLLHTYSPAQGMPELVDALQRKITKENNLNNHDVMVTVGANQAYMNVVVSLLDASSKAIVFAPYYFNHVMAIQMTCGDDAVVVGPTSDQGIPDLDWLRDELVRDPNVRLVTIVNPGNPTGVSLSKEYLRQVVDLCQQYRVWLVLDCTYEYFTDPLLNHQPLATFSDAPNVIHIFSLSKSYSLAGYRCGYIVSHKGAVGLYASLLKVQDTIPIGPPRISQVVALGALQAGKEWVYQKYVTLDHSREIMLKALHPLTTMGGSGSMYLMAQLPCTLQLEREEEHAEEPIDVAVCRQLVKDHGLAIIPGSFCGFPGWIRICYANLPPEKCEIAAKRLQEGIAHIVLANS
jgi:aspartate/methionine/tyrosine aminotransferase